MSRIILNPFQQFKRNFKNNLGMVKLMEIRLNKYNRIKILK